MRRKSINGIIAIIAFVLVHLTTNVSAQTDVSRFKEAIKKDSTLIYGLAGYDAAVRDDILTVAQHPEVLTRLVEMKNISASSFKSLIENLDRDTQFGIYELSRYPDLVKELTIQGKLKKNDVENIILSYPEDIHEAALNYGRKQYKVLASIDRMNDKNKQDFETLIGKYDSNFQASMQRLIETPEVLSTMAENIEFARLAGSVYSKYPKELGAKLEVWHNEIKAKKEQELADYEAKLKEDPEAYQEMLDAAEQFASDEMGNKAVTEPVREEVEVVNVNHYSYWYGYPHWYGYPYWRPYPWYYHTGFYYRPGGGVIFIGMPSYWYVGWHHRYYPNRYPQLSYHYYRHAHRHPRSYYNFNRTVNVNINNNINIDRSRLAKIDNNRSKIIPKQWPKQWPTQRPEARPGQRPSERPGTRPSDRPTSRPNQPSERPATRPSQPTQRPATRPSTPTQRPETRPATRPSNGVNYNNYRSNESFRQNWSRPSTPASRPAARPATRPAGGGRSR